MQLVETSTPFYWRARKSWFIKIRDENGKRSNLFLGGTKEDALKELDRIKLEIENERIESIKRKSDCLFLELADDWAVHQQKRLSREEVSAEWLTNRQSIIERFLGNEHVPDLRCSEITPIIVREWLNSLYWAADTELTAIRTIRQVLNWGVKQKIIQQSNLTGIDLPQGKHRDFIVTPWLHVRMMAKASKRGRLIIESLRLTGARPGEIRAVRIEDLAADYSCFILKEHKTKRKTGKARTVYLSPGGQRLFRKLVGNRKSGFVFISHLGKQLTQNSIRCLFKRLRKKLNPDNEDSEPVNSYSFRHAFATNALLKGIPIATVAQLLGNSVEMIDKHYGHLAKQPDYLREAVGKVNG